MDLEKLELIRREMIAKCVFELLELDKNDTTYLDKEMKERLRRIIKLAFCEYSEAEEIGWQE